MAKTIKERFTVHLDVELVDRVRNAVYWLSGPPERLTISELVDKALRVQLKKLERKHNKGEPFKRRGSELTGGRPIGT